MAIDLEELAARAEIADTLHSYCRGIDRLDVDAVKAAYHEDGVLIDYAPEPQAAMPFSEAVIERLPLKFSATQHRVTNIRVERTGNTALVESYILAFHTEDTPEGQFLHTFNGRWIDTFEDRGTGWRIAQRVLRMDWSRRDPWNEDMAGQWPRSSRDRSDVLYA